MNRGALVFGAAIAVLGTIASYGQTPTDQQKTPAPNQQPTQVPSGQGMTDSQGRMQNFRAEYIQHYEALSATDKEKVKSIHEQIAALHKQEYQILGMTAPAPWERRSEKSE